MSVPLVTTTPASAGSLAKIAVTRRDSRSQSSSDSDALLALANASRSISMPAGVPPGSARTRSSGVSLPAGALAMVPPVAIRRTRVAARASPAAAQTEQRRAEGRAQARRSPHVAGWPAGWAMRCARASHSASMRAAASGVGP